MLKAPKIVAYFPLQNNQPMVFVVLGPNYAFEFHVKKAGEFKREGSFSKARFLKTITLPKVTFDFVCIFLYYYIQRIRVDFK